MANRRMISRSISLSKQVNRMSLFAQLLFTWSVVHADDFGCLDGDPEVVQATVIPLKRGYTPDDVGAAINEWVDAQLVYWFQVGDQMVIQFRSWERHQTGLHKRTKAKYPLYQDSQDSGNFREFLGTSALIELNRTELKGTEGKRTEGQKPSSSSSENPLSKLTQMYEHEGFGPLSYTVQQWLEDFLDTYSYAWVVQAMTEAVAHNKKSLSYLKKILTNWRAEGGPDAAKAKHEAATTGGKMDVTITAKRDGGNGKRQRDGEDWKTIESNFFA